jgi:hypothetical protein
LQIINNIKIAHENAPPRQKKSVLSLVSPVFSLKQLHQAGFDITPDSYAISQKHAADFYPGAPVAKPSTPPSKQPIEKEELKNIKEFLTENSHVSATDPTVRYIEGLQSDFQ